MMSYEARFLVKGSLQEGTHQYQIIEEVMDYQTASCIIIRNMHPDFTLLLSQLQLIITERGSPLSHLALIAREYDKTILQVDNITQDIPHSGHIDITSHHETATLHIR